MTESYFHIAIDGPVAAGKGTVSKLTADRLGFLYIDTGAMYRVTALLGLLNNVDWDDEDGLTELVNKSEIDMHNPTADEADGRLTTVTLNQEDVSWKIRTPEVGNGSSKVAVHPKVRKALVTKQQKIAEGKNIVMEGRDITSVVLPNADLKIYLTATDTERAKRRQLELQMKGHDVTLEEVHKDLIERDERDMNRVSDPLKIVPDAWVLDTTELDVEEVVDSIVKRVTDMRQPV